MISSIANIKSSLTKSPSRTGMHASTLLVLEVISRDAFRVAFRIGSAWYSVTRTLPPRTSLLLALSKRFPSLSHIKKMGVLMGNGSFTSTRIMGCIAQSLAFASSTRIASLPADFFDVTDDQKNKMIKGASWGNAVPQVYSGKPNITFPKK